MRILPLLLLPVVLIFPAAGTADSILALPESFGPDPALIMAEAPRVWTPDTMYEHVNGEAELLKRYGARHLTYAAYEGGGAFFSVDILDMGAPINAFGLYSLYAGCDGDEYSASGGTVLSGEYTSYALLGRYFMRIDSENTEGIKKRNPLVTAFLSEFSTVLPLPGTLPGVAERLKEQARKPCEVGYHPEHVDYDLEAGPGYTWTGPDGGTYFLSFLSSVLEARSHADDLRNRGAKGVLVLENAVAWPKVAGQESENYLKGMLKLVVER